MYLRSLQRTFDGSYVIYRCMSASLRYDRAQGLNNNNKKKYLAKEKEKE